MHSFPIDFPAPDAPDTPVHRLARALGIHPYVIALGTMGWTIAPRAYHTETSRPGLSMSHTWFVADSPAGDPTRSIATASALLATLTARDELHLTRQNPAHHLLAILAALHTLATLQAWHHTGGPVPIPASQPDRYGIYHHLPATGEPHTPIDQPTGITFRAALTDLHAIAAAITCGFRIATHTVTGPDGQTGLPVSPHSTTFPGLTDHHLIAPGHPGPTIPLPDSAPGEHPYQYALTACRNVPAMLHMQTARARNPILHRPGLYDPGRFSLVTHSLLEGKDPRSRQLYAAVRKHLAATVGELHNS